MTDEKNPQEAKIRKGLPPKRSATSFQVMRDIVIPAGTLLRTAGDDKFAAEIGIGLDGKAEFVVTVKPDAVALGLLRRVTAA